MKTNTNYYKGELEYLRNELKNELTEEEKEIGKFARILVEVFLWQEEQKHKEKHPELYPDQEE